MKKKELARIIQEEYDRTRSEPDEYMLKTIENESDENGKLSITNVVSIAYDAAIARSMVIVQRVLERILCEE